MRNRLVRVVSLCFWLSVAAGAAEAQTAAAYVSPGGADPQQLVAAMKASNLELQAARQRLAQADGRLRQYGLWLNPRAELEDKSFQFSSDRGSRERELALVQPLELGGRRSARLRLGEAGREMVRFEIADLERRFTAELRLQFGEGLAVAARLKALEEALVLQQRMERAMVLRVSAGDASRFEMALSEAETARLEAERYAWVGRLESLLAGMKTVIGLPQSAPLLLRDQDLGNSLAPAEFPLQEAVLVEKALAQRPDLQAARWRAAMAERGLKLAEANAFPEVGVLVGFKQQQSSPPSPGLSPGSNWLLRLGVSVGLPLFHRNQGARQESAALWAEARLAADFAEQVVRRDVHVALRRLELTEHALRLVGRRLLPQTESAARMARLGYDLGEISLPQLILEQRRVLEAHGTLVEAGLEAYRARAELARALGL